MSSALTSGRIGTIGSFFPPLKKDPLFPVGAENTPDTPDTPDTPAKQPMESGRMIQAKQHFTSVMASMLRTKMTPSEQIKGFLAARSQKYAGNNFFEPLQNNVSQLKQAPCPAPEPPNDCLSRRKETEFLSRESGPMTLAKDWSASDSEISVSSVADDDPEARRIAGELVKLHRDGAIKGADDPEAHFFASLLHTFGATYNGKGGA
jgi:hypothetical protein